MDSAKVEALIEEGYISKFGHSTLPIFGLNYTPKAQIDKKWTPETLQCRGLVVDKDYNIVGRCFKKIFNFEEHFGKLPTGNYDVWDKVDGSLIIVCWYDDVLVVTTRGSFDSNQSNWAKELLQTVYSEQVSKLDRNFTYLFELVHPDNRIVINYGNIKELRLLAVIHTKDDWEIQPSKELHGFNTPEFFGTLEQKENPLNLRLLEQSNKEGFVIRWHSSNLRLKIKFHEYVRLHRILSYHDSVHIWEALRMDGEEGVLRLLEQLPDEYYADTERWISRIQENFKAIDTEVKEWYDRRNREASRKELAEFFSKYRYPHLLFSMLDDKSSYRDEIYKLIKPPRYTLGFMGVREDLDNPEIY